MTPAELLAATLSSAGRVAVTGASGWFGMTAVDLLVDAWGPEAANRVAAYAGSARLITLPSGRAWPVRALPELLSDPAPGVLLHFAYLTRERAAELGTPAYVARNAQLSATVLEAVRRHRPRIVVTTSSGAVYERDGGLANDLAANPYGALKAIDELAFARAAEQVGAGWSIPRVFSVAGPGMTRPAKYALGSMIAMARSGGPIVVEAARPVLRSYCGVSEVIALAVWAAGRGTSGVFDTGGHVVEMADLATAVAAAVGDGCTVERPDFDPSAEPDRYLGDPAAFTSLTRGSGLGLASLHDLIVSTSGGLDGR